MTEVQVFRFLRLIIKQLIQKMQQQQKMGNFISKLEYILNNQEYSEIICWDETNTMIDILDIQKMETQIIPHFFRHKKLQSFVRQLNLYGFRKIKQNGKYRFTHSQLLKGNRLNQITSNKISKKQTEKDRKHNKLEEINQNENQTGGVNQIERKKLFQNLNNFNQNRTQTEFNLTNMIVIPALPNNQALLSQPCLIPDQYFNLWNMFMFQSPPTQAFFYTNPMQTIQ